MGSYQQFKYKKHFIRKNVFMRKHMFLNITVVVALMLAISFCMACSGGQADNHEKIDYTVVENEDLPIELKKLIDNKKQSTLRLTERQHRTIPILLQDMELRRRLDTA